MNPGLSLSVLTRRQQVRLATHTLSSLGLNVLKMRGEAAERRGGGGGNERGSASCLNCAPAALAPSPRGREMSCTSPLHGAAECPTYHHLILTPRRKGVATK